MTSHSDDTDSPTPRREFLGQIAASAIVLAGTACAGPIAASQAATPSPAPATPAPVPQAPVHWDDSWFTRLTARHKAVFDSPMIEDGLVLSNAAGYIRGMREAVAAGPTDVQTVVVLRHQAVPMVLNDAMWEKYAIGKDRKVKDERTDKWATRNPFAGSARQVALAASARAEASGGASASSSAPAMDRPQANLGWLASHGHIILGCDLATRGYAGLVAGRTKGDSHAIYEEFKANLLPGVILQPTGVYAAHRAQEAGCTYIRST